jgi:flagellar biogenesis protein FliO
MRNRYSLRIGKLQVQSLVLGLRWFNACIALMFSTLLLTAHPISAQSPQLPQYTQQGYDTSLPDNTRPATTPSNEVRVDPFVTPASSLSSPATSNPAAIPYKSSGSASDVPSIPNRSESGVPQTFQPSTSSALAANNSLTLKPRSAVTSSTSEGADKNRSSSFGSVLTMFTSLLVVVTLFFAFMFMLKKANGGNTSELPRDVFQVMGTSRLAGRHSLFLLRLGHKLVLVHAGSGEVQTITEVTDPAEVDRLCGSCEENQPNSLTQSFKQVLKTVTEGGSSKPKSFADHLRFRNKAKDEADEISPAVALLAKEKS